MAPRHGGLADRAQIMFGIWGAYCRRFDVVVVVVVVLTLTHRQNQVRGHTKVLES